MFWCLLLHASNSLIHRWMPKVFSVCILFGHCKNILDMGCEQESRPNEVSTPPRMKIELFDLEEYHRKPAQLENGRAIRNLLVYNMGI